MDQLSKLRSIVVQGRLRTKPAMNRALFNKVVKKGTTPFGAKQDFMFSRSYADDAMVPLPEEYPGNDKVMEILRQMQASMRVAGMAFGSTNDSVVKSSLRDPRSVPQFSVSNAELDMVKQEG